MFVSAEDFTYDRPKRVSRVAVEESVPEACRTRHRAEDQHLRVAALNRRPRVDDKRRRLGQTTTFRASAGNARWTSPSNNWLSCFDCRTYSRPKNLRLTPPRAAVWLSSIQDP